MASLPCYIKEMKMSKPFTLVTVIVLSLIALLQLVRFVMAWEVVISGVMIPVWVSAIACLVAAGLAFMLWREAQR